MANARKAAINCLLTIDRDGCYSNIAIDNTLKRSDMQGADSALFSALVYGVLDRKYLLDYIISKCSSKTINKLSLFVLETLRVSVLQLKFMDRIPPFAAINEAVAIVKKSKERYASGFVNAVLRAVQRETIDLPQPSDAENLSILCSCDINIVNRLIDDYGGEKTYSIIAPKDAALPIYIRVNTSKCSAEELTRSLIEDGLSVDKVDGFSSTLAVKGAIERSSAFKKGWFHIQDLSCQRACEALSAHEGMRVLDACAAPGGKSFTIAQIMNNNGEIISGDIHNHRVNLIEQSKRRLGYTCVNAVVRDAAVFDDSLGLFDRVLCDVPCSGIGVIHRKPDIRYKNGNDFSDLPDLQYAILTASSKHLKPGGILVYSTCTLFKEENEGVFDKFMSENSDFEVLPFEDGEYCKTILPDGDSDGFFFARAKRKEV